MKGIVITGTGIIAPNGVGMSEFWASSTAGVDSISRINSFDTNPSSINMAGEIDDNRINQFFEKTNQNKYNKCTKMLIGAAELAIANSMLSINETNCRRIGIATGTSFSHLFPIYEFQKEVNKEGIKFADPAFFPATVLSEPSSQLAIKHNIQGFNTTLSSSRVSGLAALSYSIDAIRAGMADVVLCCTVEALSYPLFFGFYKANMLAGSNGEEPFYSPFDKKSNGLLLGEASTVLVVESEETAINRGAKINARIKGVRTCNIPKRFCSIDIEGLGLSYNIDSIIKTIDIDRNDIDLIASGANSYKPIDTSEISALKRIFGDGLRDIPINAIASTIGDTLSASSGVQIVLAICAINNNEIPPDNYCYFKKSNCSRNPESHQVVKNVLVTSSGFGGYSGACLLSN